VSPHYFGICVDRYDYLWHHSTEIGCFSLTFPAAAPDIDEWEYFEFSPHLDIEMVPQEGMENVFEVVIIVRV